MKLSVLRKDFSPTKDLLFVSTGRHAPNRRSPSSSPFTTKVANFKALWGEIASSIQTPFTAIVVYDFDADNTVPVVKELIASGETRL